MLIPSNRLTLIDAMRPPAGFRLESAMAVTYTLNLQALLAAPAAFAIAGLGDTSADAGGQTPVELIHALRSNAHKLTVFSEAGEIGLPPSSRAFAFLEGAVVPVTAPRGGIVHPKVWVLRYEASGQTSHNVIARPLRVLIASRNLTFDESWDTVLRLDETPHPGAVALDEVGDLFQGLLKNTVGDIGAGHKDRVQSLAKALRTARFELPSGVDDLRIHVFGLEERSPPLPTNSDRSLIISPFLTDDFFVRVHPAPVDILISRQESLDGIQPGTLDSVGAKYVFDDGSAIEPGDPENGRSLGDDGKPDRAAPPTLSTEDPGRPLVGLHAKVFAFEVGDRAHLFVGSANATGAAFHNNVEILAELGGPVAELGIDRLCDGDGEDPGLRDLFHVYHPGPDNGNGQDDSGLDGMRRRMACLPMEGVVERTGEEGEEWAVTYRSPESLPAVEGVEIHCWPLTTPGNRRPVRTTEPFEVRFETSLDNLSGFLAFELVSDGGEQTSFAVPVSLVCVPEHRNRSLMRALIGNAERFLRYLLALLYEESDQVDLRDVARVVDGSASDGNGSISLAVLEQLVSTMRRDPLKLAGLHPLVADLRSDGALPPGFGELWDAIHDVAIKGADERGANSP